MFEILQKLANKLKLKLTDKDARTFIFINQKGGIGKTTLVHAFVVVLARLGFNVLAIDLDPSGNISNNSKADRSEQPGSMELMLEAATVEETIQYIEDPGYYLIAAPEDRQLENKSFIKMLEQTSEPVLSLRHALASVLKNFHFVVIDTGPNLNDATNNAVYAADEILVPTTINANSLDGIKDLYNLICTAREQGGRAFPIKGIIVNRFIARGKADRETNDFILEIAEALEAPVFKTYIRNSVVVESATKNRQAITGFKPAASSAIVDDIYRFTEEFLKGELENAETKS